MKLKEIKLYPSVWTLDVIVGGTSKQLSEISESRYGLQSDPLLHNECCSVDTSVKSKLKGEKRVVITLKNYDKTVIVHEIIHALWHISKYVGYQMNYDTQEWQAVLAEYLYKEIIDKKGYFDLIK